MFQRRWSGAIYISMAGWQPESEIRNCFVFEISIFSGRLPIATSSKQSVLKNILRSLTEGRPLARIGGLDAVLTDILPIEPVSFRNSLTLRCHPAKRMVFEQQKLDLIPGYLLAEQLDAAKHLSRG